MKKNILFTLNFVLISGLAFCQVSSAQQNINLSVMAKPSTAGGGRGGGGNSDALNAIINGIDPKNSADREHGAFTVGFGGGRRGTPAPEGMQTNYVQLTWSQPISTKKVDLYWLIATGEGRGGRGGAVAPKAYRIKYWDADKGDYLPVENANGMQSVSNKYNTTTFTEVRTDKLRVEFDYEAGTNGAPGILQCKVYDSGKSPNFAPIVTIDKEHDVLVSVPHHLHGTALDEGKPKPLAITWAKLSGPGDVKFATPHSASTAATFTKTGDYVVQLVANDGAIKTDRTVALKVVVAPPKDRLDVVYTKNYTINNPLWNSRAKSLMIGWIPHCIDEINDTSLSQGGIDNFIEAAKALRGEPHNAHKGYPFSNAWVHQTVEAMCIALMIDPQGDPEIIAAQAKMRATLDDWIPKILAAQEPDGYLQTRFTAGSRNDRVPATHWNPATRTEHEGYVAGYFIESAINHYTMTDGKDRRLYDAAKRLADCWYNNLGPAPKKAWYDGHQEMEQALVRFGRFVNDMEGPGSHGDNYIKLAKFLLDSRRGGSEYDQSHLPVNQQYEAVGHAVRASYTYSGMADVSAETHDPDYQSAVMSIWDNIVNRKYYITGGIGSGETSEGFGPDYSLQNNAYCESCSTCGLIFFQWKMNLAYHDAKYADLYEESLYNALLGATDLKGETFYYTNPLMGGNRTAWHTCPCCVGNIPRTLLMIPTWAYVKDEKGIYVNLYIGSTINVERVAGTDVQMVQQTDYPWNGKVSITVNPKVSKRFTVSVRVPNRTTSELYTPTPTVYGIGPVTVNGKAMTVAVDKGYVAITREWKAGDKIDFELPMEVQRVKASDKIRADRGLVALRYGPLIYNVERADQSDISKAIGSTPLTTEWRGDLLDGVMVIKGTWADGSPLVAIPNYARNNRLGQVATAAVGGDSTIDYSGANGGAVAAAQTSTNTAAGTNGGGFSSTNAPAGANGGGRRGGRGSSSNVWIKDSVGGTP